VIRAEEITSVLLQELEAIEKVVEMTDIGYVIEVGDGVARAYGLQGAMASELLYFPQASERLGREFYGIALNLEMDSVGIVLLGPDQFVREGDEVRCTGRVVEVPVGKELLGRVINPVGQPLDGKGPITAKEFRRIEVKAPGVVKRQPVKEPLMTGLKAIDSMIPIGRGQRELILGDRQTGKTAIIVDTIINQKRFHEAGDPVYCIYVAIGQKQSTVKSVVETLERYGAMEYTIVVSAPASEPASLQYIAPYAGCAMGEWFRDNGMHAVIFYDDLSKHAQAYRQVSLLLRRPPGREAYPGDVFNLHSRLLERAAKLSDELGAGSLTAIPVIETQLGDYSAYIPTNVISITDGQIYLEPDLFYAGIRPAINVGISVSRVGSAAQYPAMKKVARRLKLDMARYFELAAFAQFAAELDEVTRRELIRGERLVEVLKQDQYQPMALWEQVMIIFAGVNGYLDDMPAEWVRPFEKEFLPWVKERYPEIVHEIETTKDFSAETEQKMHKAVQEFKERFVAARKQVEAQAELAAAS
jgi:F-type H+-transporting ATPase subunit alpha